MTKDELHCAGVHLCNLDGLLGPLFGSFLVAKKYDLNKTICYILVRLLINRRLLCFRPYANPADRW